MSLFRLACSNFKRSLREFGMLILSLSFSVLILFNFQNVIYSDSMKVLQDYNKEYIDLIIQAVSIVFVAFLFFFIWYASNVFLNQRKKEIGIYVFMGLDNRRIGKMYAIESLLVGLFSLAAGLIAGVAFSKLFQMVLLKLSEISVDVKFSFSLRPLIITAEMFLVIYGLMTLKGYCALKASSVLNLLSGAKQKEIRPEHKLITFLRIVLGIAVLSMGYVAAWRTGGLSSLQLALAAVVLVILGVYLLYSGLIPAILRGLTKNKKYLYRKERNLWVNSLAFRVKKNYRTYAMVTVLMICSVTVMATSIALKQRYEKMLHFDQAYTYQILSSHEWNGEEIAAGIGETNEVMCWNSFPVVMLEDGVLRSEYEDSYGVAAYSDIKAAAEKAGLSFDFPELSEHQLIELQHELLLSFVDMDTAGQQVQIDGETYEIAAASATPYLGKIQAMQGIYIVSDRTFEKLKSLGTVTWFYNYRIAHPENVDASRPYLMTLAEQGDGAWTGINYAEGEQREDSWVRVMYSLCLFLFATMILASGSILFLKTGNEAYEDRERYLVLQKLGIRRAALRRAVRNEICFTYYCPFVLMVLTSYFSVRALGNVMQENLFRVNVWSAAVILLLFGAVCALSVRKARKKLGL